MSRLTKELHPNLWRYAERARDIAMSIWNEHRHVPQTSELDDIIINSALERARDEFVINELCGAHGRIYHETV